MPVELRTLVNTANSWLMPKPINDYCPNGLQVEGRGQVRRIVSGVTASQALLDAAVAAGADVVLVHHGYFWKSEASAITGMKKRRLQTLLQNDISLLAYHLPLDLHEELGNNVQLARHLDFKISPVENSAEGGLIRVGELPREMSGDELAAHLAQRLGRQPQHIAAGPARIRNVAWCTGAAQGYLERVLDLGVDAYISGEISEPTVHVARENNIHYFGAGHHATERYGVQALGQRLADTFNLEHEFIDIDNPV